MNPNPNPTQRRNWNSTRLLACGVFLTSLTTVSAAQDMYRPANTWPGGLDPQPYINWITETQQTATVSIQGLMPPFQVERSDSLDNPNWTNVGSPTSGGTVELPLTGTLGIIRVRGNDPVFVGAETCKMCHSAPHNSWTNTAHARALDTLKAIGQGANASCLPCHTVGFGYEGGYKDEATTPDLAGVQCENCHGPGGSHVGNISDPTRRPKVTIAAETCGGCHTDAHHPTYDEWSEARHSKIDPHVAEYFLDPVGGQSRMFSCGSCHSGAVRLAMLKTLPEAINPGTGENLDKLPTGSDAAYYGQTCAVCHNAHENTLSSQLRNPVYSTNYFTYNTSTNTSFAVQYNPDIQLCAQCHNHRGAAWNSSSRAPHHSGQYNILVGQIVQPGTADAGWNWEPVTHGKQPLQCTQCHTHPHNVDNPTEEDPNYTGHTFEPTMHACVQCHGTEEISAALLEGGQAATKQNIAQTVAALQQWSTTKAPEAIRNKYGVNSWEYSSPGQLSDPVLKAPTSGEQSQIPNEIKKARFLLYLVEHDGSYGIHNGMYTRQLLDQARTLIESAP